MIETCEVALFFGTLGNMCGWVDGSLVALRRIGGTKHELVSAPATRAPLFALRMLLNGNLHQGMWSWSRSTLMHPKATW